MSANSTLLLERLVAGLIAALTAVVVFTSGVVAVTDLPAANVLFVELASTFAAALAATLTPRESHVGRALALAFAGAMVALLLAPMGGSSVRLFYTAPIALHFVGAYVSGPLLFASVTTLIVAYRQER